MLPHTQAKAWCADLEAAGVRAVSDPRYILPPCVLIAPPSVTFDTGCGGSGSWRVHLLAPGAGDGDAWLQLDKLLAVVLDVLPVEEMAPASYEVDDTSYPAYICSFDTPVSYQ